MTGGSRSDKSQPSGQLGRALRLQLTAFGNVFFWCRVLQRSSFRQAPAATPLHHDVVGSERPPWDLEMDAITPPPPFMCMMTLPQALIVFLKRTAFYVQHQPPHHRRSRESRRPVELSKSCARHPSLLTDTCRSGTVVVGTFCLMPGNGIINLGVDSSQSKSRAAASIAVTTLKQQGAWRHLPRGIIIILSLGLDQASQRPCCIMCEHHGTQQ